MWAHGTTNLVFGAYDLATEKEFLITDRNRTAETLMAFSCRKHPAFVGFQTYRLLITQ
jgi:hypothetical protein